MLGRMKKWIKGQARNMLGFHEIMNALNARSGHAPAPGSYEVLPGSEYARYAIPLDYMPSRDYKPRWGNLCPPIEALTEFFTRYQDDYKELLLYLRGLELRHIKPFVSQTEKGVNTGWLGGAMCPFDEMALYGLVAKYKPNVFIEVGSGISTHFARQAIGDFQLQTRLISIDPAPRMDINDICDEVHRESLEKIDISYFDQLAPGDICFIDGSHRSFTNSDCTVFFIDILPRLKPGVIIHLHDITLPWDYPDMFLHWYWNEQYLLACYLMAAQEYVTPLFPTAFVCRNSLFEEYFQTSFCAHEALKDTNIWRGGGSFWFTKKARQA